MRDECIAYYRDEQHRQSDVLQGLIPLKDATACMTPQSTEMSFQINTPGRIFLLQADTEQAARKWLQQIQAACVRATVNDEPVLERSVSSVRRKRPATTQGMLHVMQGWLVALSVQHHALNRSRTGTNNRWLPQWLAVRSGVLYVSDSKQDKPKLKIPLYHCGLAECENETI